MFDIKRICVFPLVTNAWVYNQLVKVCYCRQNVQSNLWPLEWKLYLNNDTKLPRLHRSTKDEKLQWERTSGDAKL